ncbi:MAG: imidazole glycerol phosphate synthase subunit HisF [Saprospiraceae bacterium]
MLKKRIIPCLDIRDGRTVKGVNFVDIVDAGDPIVLAKRYVEQGADELVFLDITATIEKRDTLYELVERIAAEINIPFTVGGGVSSVEHVEMLTRLGADKVAVNSAAVKRPALIREIAEKFGSQCLVVAIDTKWIDDRWTVATHGGKKMTTLETTAWAKQIEAFGAGEILLTSMDHDGTKKGFALALNNQICEAVNIPVIASGGAGKQEHFKTLFEQTPIIAALAASIFHFGEVPIPTLKNYLRTQNLPVR